MCLIDSHLINLHSCLYLYYQKEQEEYYCEIEGKCSEYLIKNPL